MPDQPAGVLTTIRQPRYAALGALMLVVAIICTACGVWQIFRYESKHDENQALRRNAAKPATTAAALLPVVGQGAAPSRDVIEFRQLKITGRFDARNETLVRSRTDGDATGFLVLTPLRTAGPTLLVVRGFITQPTSGAIPPAPTPPSGTVTVLVRAQLPESRGDQFAELNDRQVSAINPRDQATRLGGAVYNGFGELEAGQPGSEGLQDLPRPDLSNPAGGALEPQHFAYVIQWFLFAGLALAAPFVMARAESKRAGEDDVEDERFADAPPPVSLADQLAGLDDESPADDPRADKLADRYGRPVR